MQKRTNTRIAKDGRDLERKEKGLRLLIPYRFANIYAEPTNRREEQLQRGGKGEACSGRKSKSKGQRKQSKGNLGKR